MGSLKLGDRRYDLTSKAMVMGILNRTKDSFFDQGAYFAFDAFLSKAEELVVAGADILDVGGVKAGAGPEVSTEEEIERVVPAVEALHQRFDVPVSVDTWNAKVLDASMAAGAVIGNDISGFADPGYLTAAASHGGAVVATHIRLAPRVPDPDAHYDDVVETVRDFLIDRAARAIEAGVDPDSVIVDAGLDLGKNTEHSLALLRRSGVLAGLGYTLLLSASNKDVLGAHLDLELRERGPASISAAAIAYLGGARIFRVHDVRGTRRALEVLAELIEHRR
ncbi:MAG: dihydropteroate synthase [Actinomycetota bacterium]|nr:dihydropteroate synthase [Actinomycetota bacterium]